MKQNVIDLEPGMIMLVVKNEDGTFSPLGMSKEQAKFLQRVVSCMSQEDALIKKNTYLSVKKIEHEKEGNICNGND